MTRSEVAKILKRIDSHQEKIRDLCQKLKDAGQDDLVEVLDDNEIPALAWAIDMLSSYKKER
jgi:hypothetical protein